jgi:hypothetical protein
MHDGVNPAARRLNGRKIAQVSADICAGAVGGKPKIERADVMAGGFSEVFHDGAPDEAAAAGYENSHAAHPYALESTVPYAQ